MFLESGRIAEERIKAARIPEPVQETIDLVFTCDQNFLPYTAVTLASVLKNYKGLQPLRVFLLLDKLMSEEDLRRYEALSSLHPFTLCQIPADAEAFGYIPIFPVFSLASYYRLSMPSLLPADCHKALYLDSDVIVLDSIDLLFSVPFDGAAFRGVEDGFSFFLPRTSVPPDASPYVNAGVLLANIDLLRSIDLPMLVARYLDANRYRMTTQDQQVINEVLHNFIARAPIRWNVQKIMLKPKWLKKISKITPAINVNEVKKQIISPSIIHYTSWKKPWVSIQYKESNLWFFYLHLTEYSALIKKPSKLSAFTKKVLHNRSLSDIKTRLPIAAKVWTRTLLSRIPGHLRRASRRSLATAAAKTPTTFAPLDAVEKWTTHSPVLSSLGCGDLVRGFYENLKTVLKTANLEGAASLEGSARLTPTAVVLTPQCSKPRTFWDCLETARFFDLPLLFVDAALFGAFAAPGDPSASLGPRRAFGFMFDDKGFADDASRPSRLEQTLNDPAFALTDEQRRRAEALIARVVSENITKYSKYVGTPSPVPIEEGAVLVAGQKNGDPAPFSDDAFNARLTEAMRAACAESNGRTVYFKKHPSCILSPSDRDLMLEKGVVLLPDAVGIDAVLDRCSTVYAVSSQIGFEALLRRKKVVVFGTPFYAGWGLTDDRNPLPRRTQKRTVEDLFHLACIDLSLYCNPGTGTLIPMEEAIDMVLDMRAFYASSR